MLHKRKVLDEGIKKATIKWVFYKNSQQRNLLFISGFADKLNL